jgi:hypothetical protein
LTKFLHAPWQAFLHAVDDAASGFDYDYPANFNLLETSLAAQGLFVTSVSKVPGGRAVSGASLDVRSGLK